MDGIVMGSNSKDDSQVKLAFIPQKMKLRIYRLILPHCQVT